MFEFIALCCVVLCLFVLCYAVLCCNAASFFMILMNSQTYFYLLLVGGDVICMELILQNGGEVNMLDHRGRTPLHYSAECNKSECCRILQVKKRNTKENKKQKQKQTKPFKFLTLHFFLKG